MAQRGMLPAIDEDDYEAIEAAVVETARGRWFLGEFARRNRTADTTILLDAVARLERTIADRGARDLDRMRLDLVAMAQAIAPTEAEIGTPPSADRHDGEPTIASQALDEVARTTERASSDIIDAAERMQEAAWALREGGADASLCGDLDRHATAIYTACARQDLTARQTARIVETLRFLETRLDEMLETLGGAPDGGVPAPTTPTPPLGPGPKASPDRDVTDDGATLAGPVLDAAAAPTDQDTGSVEAPNPPQAGLDATPVVATTPSGYLAPIRLDAFTAIDALGAHDKLTRFT